MKRLKGEHSHEEAGVVCKILDWCGQHGFKIRRGRGRRWAQINLFREHRGKDVKLFYIYEYPGSTKFAVCLWVVEDPHLRKELLTRLSDLGFTIWDQPHYPSLDCVLLQESHRWARFEKTLHWMANLALGGEPS